MPNEVMRLPLPEHLEPVNIEQSLKANVRKYFYQLYNGRDMAFKDHLASVTNKDSITKNLWFDRHKAVGMIKFAAKEAGDQSMADAPDGFIWKYVVDIMRKHSGLSLKDRRRQYVELTQAAE